MTDFVPKIFDEALRLKRYARALKQDSLPDFLLPYIVEEINGRLLDINRDFSMTLMITPYPQLTPMFSVLERKTTHLFTAHSSALNSPDIVFDGSLLPIKKESCDLIIILGGLHVINDLLGTLIQVRQSLKPDGWMLAAFPAGRSLYELRHAFMHAEAEYENVVYPHIHPFADLRDLGHLLQRAGFTLPVVDHNELTVYYQNPLTLLTDLRAMGETNILHERSRLPLKRAVLLQAMQWYQKLFSRDDGKVSACFDIHYLSGWAAHESQQKPLIRGSAEMRFEDALKNTNN